MHPIAKLYEKLTGRRYYTVYRLSEHFRDRPPVQVRHAAEMAAHSDGELMAHGRRILVDLAARDRRSADGRPTRAKRSAVMR